VGVLVVTEPQVVGDLADVSREILTEPFWVELGVGVADDCGL